MARGLAAAASAAEEAGGGGLDREALVSPEHAAEDAPPPRLFRKQGWKLSLALAAALVASLLCALAMPRPARGGTAASGVAAVVGLRAARSAMADSSEGAARSFAQVRIAAFVKKDITKRFIHHPVRWDIVPTGKEVGEGEKFEINDLPDGTATIETVDRFRLTVHHNGTVTADAIVRPDGTVGLSEESEESIWSIDTTLQGEINLRSLKHDKCATWSAADGLHLGHCNATNATFTPAPAAEGVDARTSLRLQNGWYLGLQAGWLQDYQMVLRAVEPSKLPEVRTCMRFYMHMEDGEDVDLVSLQTLRRSYVSFEKNSSIRLDAMEKGENVTLKQLEGKDGSVSFVTSGGEMLHAWANGEVNSSNSVAKEAEKTFNVVPNNDGTVGIYTQSGKALCAIEQAVRVVTCETRRGGAGNFTMQGIQPAVVANNLGLGVKWKGYKTKVELYRAYAEQRARAALPGEIIIAVDAADVAWGGCSYEELLGRYRTISRVLGGTPVIVGADNKAWPKPKTWGYGALAHRREPLMSTYGMHKNTYCNFSDCTHPKDSHYAFANSGFLMGPPKELLLVLDCMLENGSGDYAESGFDDQAGLAECMFKHMSLIGIDYTGLLSLQLIDMKHNGVLYHRDGKVRNRAAGGLTQCFVHGNGDTLGMWWKELFPHTNMSEKWGEDFRH